MSDSKIFHRVAIKPGHRALFEFASTIRILFVFGRIILWTIFIRLNSIRYSPTIS